jgi:iron complex transport system substrate-binding protein
MLFAMGSGSAVVAVSSFDRFPPEVENLPRVGALIDPDTERILALRPDLVVVYATQTELIGRLERARVPIFRYEHAGLADVTKTVRALGVRLAREAEANALAGRIERGLADVRRRVEGRPRPRTALLFEREPGTLRGMFASAGVGFMHDMLEAAGGQDVFADIPRQSIQATAELLLARAPDVILEVHGGNPWPPARLAAELKVWSALSGVPAVRTGRVHILIDSKLAIPGPRVAEAVEMIAGVLHGR